MGKKAFAYVGVCMGIFLGLTAAEFFVFDPLLDFISQGFWGHFIMYMILLLIINPLLTRKLADLFKFEEKNEEGELL